MANPSSCASASSPPISFRLLGANAAIGRTFVASDDVSGPPAAILLSAAVWQRRYGGDPAIAGRRILVERPADHRRRGDAR